MEDYQFVQMFDHVDEYKNKQPQPHLADISGAYRYVQEQPRYQEKPPSCSNLEDSPRQTQNELYKARDDNEIFGEPGSLKALLQEWDLGELETYFIQQKITVEVLKIIKRHHIEKLFKDVPIGTQVLFEHNLENWRKTTGNPLDNTLQNEFDIINFAQHPCSPTLSTTSSSSHPYLRPETPDAGAKINLADILNTVKGQLLCSFYEANNKFEEDQRSTLINLICQYFDENQVPMSLGTSYLMEKEIVARFKNEKLEYYRTKKRGKLYNKCSNQKKITLEKDVKNPAKESRLTQNFVSENNAEACLTALKYENLSAEEFDSYWKACAKYRLNDIKTMPNSAEMFQKWPFYKKPFGYRLVDIDYEIAFGNGDLLINKWEKSFPQIVAFLEKDGRVKDKGARALLENAKISDENGKNASILWAIHGYLVPSAKFCIKNITGKTTHTKFTIKDSQESFLYYAKTQQEIEERIVGLKARKSAIQPFILCLGDDISKISNICVYFDDIRYKFFNLIKAVDICYKIIYIFNLDFPQQSKMFWNFVERAFYEQKVLLESPKVHMICESLLN